MATEPEHLNARRAILTAGTVEKPPTVLRLLAHPLRWQLVQALLTSDWRVQELVKRCDTSYNLASYHLKLMRKAGFVSLRQSDADKRDIYYHLKLAELLDAYQSATPAKYLSPEQPGSGLRNTSHPPKVIFLCTHNSARSQMAEGFLKYYGGDYFQVTSAGSQPHPIHPEAIAAMKEYGIDISQQQPRSLAEVQMQTFDLAITVCDRLREECLRQEFCPVNWHWSIPDPAMISDPTERRQAFRNVAAELRRRIWLIFAYFSNTEIEPK